MKKILLSILTLGIGAFALNAQTLDQSNTASQSATFLVNSGAYTSNGQSFTAGTTGFLHSISINIESTNTAYPILAGNFTLTIRDGNGYGGTILNIDTFTVTGAETSGWLNIPVKPNTVAITTGNSYTYIIDEISGTGQLNIFASSNAYAGGVLYSQVFTNPATIDGSRDFIFETYVQASLTCNIANQTVTASQTTFCDSGSVTITTGSSETGLNYYLVDNSGVVDGPVIGSGSALNFNSGTISNTTTYNVLATDSNIVVNNSMQFNGNGVLNRVNLGTGINSVLAGTNNITAEAWIYRTATSNLQTIVGNYQNGLQFLLRLDNNKASFWSGNNSIYTNAVGTSSIAINTWYHVAGTWDGSTIKIYVNGVLEGSTSFSGNFGNSTNEVRIGGGLDNNTENFEGLISSVRIWNITRSQTEIANNVNNCLIGNEQGLLAMYNMIDGSGSSTLTDETGNGYTGTLANMNITTAWVNNTPVDCPCQLIMNQDATVIVNNSPTSSIASQTNVSCNGGADGSATATATGGTAPYIYLWSNAATPATVTGLAAGNYSVTVTDANGCSSVQNVTITEPNALTGSISSQTNVACNGGTDGSATATATGGTAPYTYLWSNAATTATATGLAAGNYNVTITDANGCTTNVSNINITEPTALTSSISSQTNVACNGASTGAATVTTTGGTAPYTYLWSNASTTATATGLAAGNYNVTITDANGCTTNVSNINITEPTALTSSISSQTNVACNGASTGAATVTANGGTAPYTYLWSNAATTATATGLVAGTYTVTVTDANGCNSAQNVTISEPAAITGTDVQTACNSYTWIDNNTYTASNNTATHTIVGGAANGCDSIVTLNLTITTVDNSTTLNANTISANQNGATYRWLDCNNGNAVISGETAQSFTPTATGNYAVEITLGSCVDTSACTNVVITNIDEMGMKNINIYPNPTKDDINIELPLNELTSFDVSVYSVTGKLVYKNTQFNVNKLVINTANWDKGIYFIQLISNNQTITEKIIKQ